MVSASTIVLDPEIRNWVLLPLFIIMVFKGIAQHYMQQLLRSNKPAPVDRVKHTNILMRAGRVRQNAAYIPYSAFQSRKAFYNEKKVGVLRQKVRAANPMQQNPGQMVDAMKGNMANMVPNMLMMGWVSYFFSGFVLVRVPFPLTPRFKMMVQRGVDMATLDSSWVSSLSWYFLLMFGLRGFFSLLIGEEVMSGQQQMMQAQMGMMGAGQQAQQIDYNQLYAAERDRLKVVQYKSATEAAELRMIGEEAPKALPAPASSSSSGSGGLAKAGNLRRRRAGGKK